MAAVAVSIVFLTALTSCSVFMAAKQPGKKDLSVLQRGTPRGTVITELGAPSLSETERGKKIDYFSFTQGYGTATKAARAALHGTADIFTLGIWEIIGTPTESVFDGTELFNQIRRPVMLAADQTPEYANIRKAGHDGGDFLFVRPEWIISESARSSDAER